MRGEGPCCSPDARDGGLRPGVRAASAGDVPSCACARPSCSGVFRGRPPRVLTIARSLWDGLGRYSTRPRICSVTRTIHQRRRAGKGQSGARWDVGRAAGGWRRWSRGWGAVGCGCGAGAMPLSQAALYGPMAGNGATERFARQRVPRHGFCAGRVLAFAQVRCLTPCSFRLAWPKRSHRALRHAATAHQHGQSGLTERKRGKSGLRERRGAPAPAPRPPREPRARYRCAPRRLYHPPWRPTSSGTSNRSLITRSVRISSLGPSANTSASFISSTRSMAGMMSSG